MSLLAGLRVLELGGSGAARIAGVILADHGADVVALDKSGWSQRGKRILASSDRPTLDRLARGADVLLDGRPGAEAAGWLAAQAGIRCRLPAFPAGHPWSDRDPPPGVVEAAAAAYEPPIGRPRVHPVALGSVVGGLYAALAVVALARRGPTTRWIEVAMLDAALHAQELPALLTLSPPTAWTTLRWAATPFVASYRAADGRYVYLHSGLPAHLARLEPILAEVDVRLEPSDATRRDPSAPATVREAGRMRRALIRAFASRSSGWWEDRLAEASLCAAVCRTAEEWRAHPHPLETGEWTGSGPGPLTDRAGSVGAGGPVDPEDLNWDERSFPPPSTDPPLAGLRVLDVSQVIAGPVAGRALGLLGAEVDKVVNPRLEAGWVDAFRVMCDSGKTHHRVDLGEPGGREALAGLLSRRPDVVVHNLRPGTAERLGLGVDEVRQRAPGAVVARVTAYGLSGPWGGRPGWEQTAQAAVGLQVAYGGARPELIPLAVTDLCTGLSAAFGAVAALYARGRGVGVDSVTVGLTRTAGWLAEDTAIEVVDDGFQASDPAGGRPFRVPRVGLRRALYDRPHLVRRVHRPDVGGLTEVGAPWVGDGLALFATPAASAAETVDRPRGRIRWLASQVWWGSWLALTRLTG